MCLYFTTWVLQKVRLNTSAYLASFKTPMQQFISIRKPKFPLFITLGFMIIMENLKNRQQTIRDTTKLFFALVNTNTAPAGLACLWPVETEWKLLIKTIQIYLQYLFFWAIIMLSLCCKNNAITVYFLFVSSLIFTLIQVTLKAYTDAIYTKRIRYTRA